MSNSSPHNQVCYLLIRMHYDYAIKTNVLKSDLWSTPWACQLLRTGHALMPSTVPVPPLWAVVTPNPCSLIIFVLFLTAGTNVGIFCGSVCECTSVMFVLTCKDNWIIVYHTFSLCFLAARCHAITNETSKDSDFAACQIPLPCQYDCSMQSQTKDPSRGPV